MHKNGKSKMHLCKKSSRNNRNSPICNKSNPNGQLALQKYAKTNKNCYRKRRLELKNHTKQRIKGGWEKATPAELVNRFANEGIVVF